jgi:hypothetical protein
MRGNVSIGNFISVNDYGKVGTRKIRKHIGSGAGRLLGGLIYYHATPSFVCYDAHQLFHIHFFFWLKN